MTIESQAVSALAAVAGGRVYPQAAPEKAGKPFVVYRAQQTPVPILNGAIVAKHTVIAFDCWAATFQSAIDTAAAVQSAIMASGLTYSALEAAEDGYDPATDEYVRQVVFEFFSL